MRFHCTVGESTFAPLKVFGLQGPTEPKFEDKFLELKQCLVKALPLSVEEFQSDLAFSASMISVFLMTLVGLCITGRALITSVLWLLGSTVQRCKASIKMENKTQLDASFFGGVSEKKVLQEKKKVVKDIISAHEGLSYQLERVQEIVTNFAKNRRVFENSPIAVTSYTGEKELEGSVESATKTTNRSPTEDDWARYYEEEMAEQAKLKEKSKEKVSALFFDIPHWKCEKQRDSSISSWKIKSTNPTSFVWTEETFEIRKEVDKRVEESEKQIFEENLTQIQESAQHQCSSSTVIGTMRQSTNLSKINNSGVDFLATIEKVPESIHTIPFVSGCPSEMDKVMTMDDCYSFDLNPKIVDFVDDFSNDLPLITSNDIADLCRKTPLLAPLTPNETSAVEIWLRSYQAPFSFLTKYPNLWY